MRFATTFLVLASLSTVAAAQRQRAPAQPPPQPEAPKPAANEPQRTTATFDDWTLRCVRTAGSPPACEVTQTLFEKDRPVAQTALGRPASGESMRLTILVPTNITIGTPPRFEEADGKFGFDLGWRRCLPAGCLADSLLNEEQLQGLRMRTTNARITFKDAAGRDTAIPFTPRGLPAALDALAKENAG